MSQDAGLILYPIIQSFNLRLPSDYKWLQIVSPSSFEHRDSFTLLTKERAHLMCKRLVGYFSTLVAMVALLAGSAQAAVIFSDDFNRPDGAVGNGWTTWFGPTVNSPNINKDSSGNTSTATVTVTAPKTQGK